MTDLPLSKALGIVNSSDLLPLDKLTWWAIHELCVGDGKCQASTYCISQKLGYSRHERQIRRSIKNLEASGFLRVVRARGCANGYQPCVPEAQDTKGLPAKDALKRTHLKGRTFSAPVRGTPDKKDGAFCPPESLREEKNKNSTPPTPPERGGGGVKAVRPKLPTITENNTRAKVEAAINALDLPKYQKEFPELDIAALHREFREYWLTTNDVRTNKPNWRKHTHWHLVFHRRCQEVMNRYAERRVARNASARNPDSPVASTPRLSPEQIKARDEKIANIEAWADIEACPPNWFEKLQADALAHIENQQPEDRAPPQHRLKLAMVHLWRNGWKPKETGQ